MTPFHLRARLRSLVDRLLKPSSDNRWSTWDPLKEPKSEPSTPTIEIVKSPIDIELIQKLVWDFLNAPANEPGLPQVAIALPRARVLAHAFTREQSPFTRTFVAAGGLIGGFRLAWDLDPRYPDGLKQADFLAERFGTPENPTPTIEEVAGGALSLLSLLGIRHRGLDEFAEKK